MYIMRVLSIPCIWLSMAYTSCFTLTYDIFQDMKKAGILQMDPGRVCVHSTSVSCSDGWWLPLFTLPF